MRKLASVQKILSIDPIVGADAIEVATINSWKVVVKKDEFKVGDQVIYIEVDSWVPTQFAPFLSKGQPPREYQCIKGERLRTVKLRGQVSQGLVLPMKHLTNYGADLCEGADVTADLGIVKYEPPVPACLAGVVRGPFPSAIPKTDEERCLSGNTVVVTDLGPKTIKEIVDEKLQCRALSINHLTNEEEFKPIIGFSAMTRKQCWLKVTTKSGKVLVLTKNHRIWIEDLQCYRTAEDLVAGNKVKIYSKN